MIFQLAFESTARRFWPNYANVDSNGNSGYHRNNHSIFFSTMKLKTANRLDNNAEPGVNPQHKDRRGNIYLNNYYFSYFWYKKAAKYYDNGIPCGD